MVMKNMGRHGLGIGNDEGQAVVHFSKGMGLAITI